MVLRYLLRRFLLNNEELINRLAESYPIRRAAQLTAYLLHKGFSRFEKIKDSNAFHEAEEKAQSTAQRLKQFPKRLSEELKEGMKEFKDEVKKLKK